ncbi:hypothetical protein [Georgenia thermotolerans]|uniref:Uncharacterized protein n=1 Tax=Georgenia thermotolerans TaxID=527326 RepID=A0A7J5UT98_9MICO|nr:hypothetical protein [Georgenia thermotolerans]KAE8765363.1 hypothetical protein GB883_04170 [Georgenia thermotolerans]
MTRLWITLVTLAPLAYRRFTDPPVHDPERERGSVTVEHVLWAVAVIAIVGIVVLAITTYVQNQAAKIG